MTGTHRPRFFAHTISATLLVVVSLIAPRAVHAQSTTIYSTGFETPTFTIGTLEGQGGFAAYLGRNANTVKVANSFPAAGAQHLTLDSALMGLYGASTTRHALYTYPTLNYNPIGNNTPIVVARVDAALHVVNATYLPVGYQIYSISGAGICGIAIDTDGDLVAYNFGPAEGDLIVVNDVALDQYHTLTTRIDYVSERLDFFLDGTHAGFLTNISPTQNTLGDVDLYSTTTLAAGEAAPTSVGYFDNYVVTAVPAATTLVTGRVEREGCTTAAGTSARFEFRPLVGESFTRTEELSANGTFTIDGVPAGTYNIAIKTPTNLRKVLTGVVVAGNFVADLSATLLAADADDSNRVDVGDLAMLVTSFDATPSSPNWLNGAADFDCDNRVTVEDLSLLVQNFDKAGDP